MTLFSLHNKSMVIAATLILASTVTLANEPDLNSAANAKIKAFAIELKTTLQANIKQGGLTQGIAVCKNLAIPIADKHSTDGWLIKRTSLKYRNTANQPDKWELAQLKHFEQQKANGIDIKQLVATTTTVEGDFRLIKAIPTGDICLKCHGQHLPDDVKATLNNLYPNDLATGFNLGDIRGAFSVVYRKLPSKVNNSEVND